MATADVVGAYLNAYMEDFVIVKLVGDEVGIVSKLNPVYKEYVIFENGKKVLYLQLIKHCMGASSQHFYGMSVSPNACPTWVSS